MLYMNECVEVCLMQTICTHMICTLTIHIEQLKTWLLELSAQLKDVF